MHFKKSAKEIILQLGNAFCIRLHTISKCILKFVPCLYNMNLYAL